MRFPKKCFLMIFIIFSCYENAFPTNLRYFLKQEGKCSWRELIKPTQSMEEYVCESGDDP